jgi:hypothetical protein
MFKRSNRSTQRDHNEKSQETEVSTGEFYR